MEKLAKNYLLLTGLLLFSGILFTATGQTPSSNQNYLRTYTVRAAGHKTTASLSGYPVDSINQTILYFDGLGRPLQSVDWQASPTKQDLVQGFQYDVSGREVKKFLPYAAATNGAAYRSDALLGGQGVYSFYNPGGSSGTQLSIGVARIPSPFALKVIEPSPLNRILEQGSPGDTWQPVPNSSSGHTQKTDHGRNAANEAKLWIVSGSGAGSTASYAVGTLFKRILKDENWITADGRAGTVEEFMDLEGRMVLKRTWETDTKSLSTYYIYDDIGNLRYVLPPAVNENGQATITGSFTEADAVFDQFIYGYHYDGRRRTIEKKIPGRGWDHLVYNRYDQLVMAQDANQRNAGQWHVTKYDALGRVIITALISSGTDRSGWQASIDAQGGTLWEERDDANGSGTGIGYTNNKLPSLALGNCQTISFFEDYGFYGYSSAYAPSLTVSNRTKGLATAQRSNILGSSTLLMQVMYYDGMGRMVERIADNHLGGTDRTINVYNFVDELTTVTRTHIANSATTVIDNAYVYDHVGRQLDSKMNIKGQGEVVLSRWVYNEIGQQWQKNLHSTDNGTSFLQQGRLFYNERGWLKANTSAQFGFKLGYDTLSVPQYNGNISTQLWGSGGSYANRFVYSYDKLNRLTNGTSTGIAMSEVFSYDVMGNLTSMTRDALSGTYSYTGNRLNSISGGLATGAYGYDANGNATTDGRNGVALTYNHLNLPATATKTGLSMIYTYDANGSKLKQVSTTTTGATTTDYVNGVQYSNGSIDFIQTAEGLARDSAGIYRYHYNLSDHLGNVRYTFRKGSVSGVLEKLQQDDYYPFGMRKVATVGNNKYLYNGKELQDSLGQYDYGARFYDPVIGRFNTIDPLSEKSRRFSPYSYAMNNPIRFIDVDGMYAAPPDIIFKGTDDKEIRIEAAGKNKVIEVPFALKKDRNIDIGFGNVDPSRLAIGYTQSFEAGGSAGIGGRVGIEGSVVQFTDSKYSDYNYVYAGVRETASLGFQANLSADVGGTIFIAHNNDTRPISPESFAGISGSVGTAVDIKEIVGGGVSVGKFSSSAEGQPGWRGYSFGFNVGFGASVNGGSLSGTLSNTVLLNDVKPTAARTFIDRATNFLSPAPAAAIRGLLYK